jgi:hypothetical protein
MDYYFGGIRRLDWGFDNPNMTAALIAMVAVAVFGTGLVWKKLFWPSLIPGFVLSAALHQTLSRGGMVAFGCGFICLFIAIRPQLNRVKIIALLAMIVMLFAYANYHGGASRYVQGVNGKEDRSISNRWLIYKVVPQMIADAPGGWGRGQAPEAYQQWYQPEGRSETYLNLVNSHFTWLVEWPFWARILYILSWALVMVASWPQAKHPWWGVILAVWLTLFLAASFSSVAHRPWIWPLPAGLLAVLAIHRLVTWQGLSRKQILLVVSAPAGAYLTIWLIAELSRGEVKIQHRGGITIAGSTKPQNKIALCGSDQRILGERCGHRIRAHVKSNSNVSVTFFESPGTLDASYQSVILVGDAHEKFQAPKHSHLYLLNPSAPTKSMNLQDTKSIKVLWGSFNSSPAWYGWQAKASQNPGIELIKLPGEGMFLENWFNELK